MTLRSCRGSAGLLPEATYPQPFEPMEGIDVVNSLAREALPSPEEILSKRPRLRGYIHRRWHRPQKRSQPAAIFSRRLLSPRLPLAAESHNRAAVFSLSDRTPRDFKGCASVPIRFSRGVRWKLRVGIQRNYITHILEQR